MSVYLDNAATTPLDPRVFEAMEPYLKNEYGNPSSTHSHGRKVRSAIEKARKTIAEILNARPGEIYFTSSGTESDNTYLTNTILDQGIKDVITTRIEHHAVLHTLDKLEGEGKVRVHYLDLDEKGVFTTEQLVALLEQHGPALVTLMEANNEIGNLVNLKETGEICKEYNSYFHSDAVQTLGHLDHDLSTTPVHSIAGSAHKFHGPKGIGLMYLSQEQKLSPTLLGGAQERSMRAGTENVYGIVGMAKALELTHEDRDQNSTHIRKMKSYLKEELIKRIPDVSFNGLSGDLDKSLYTILNVSFPPSPANDMLLFNLDLKSISVSGGSACSSGANTGSHVLNGIGVDPDRAAVRFSFCRFNSLDDVKTVLLALDEIYTVNQIT